MTIPGPIASSWDARLRGLRAHGSQVRESSPQDVRGVAQRKRGRLAFERAIAAALVVSCEGWWVAAPVLLQDGRAEHEEKGTAFAATAAVC